MTAARIDLASARHLADRAAAVGLLDDADRQDLETVMDEIDHLRRLLGTGTGTRTGDPARPETSG